VIHLLRKLTLLFAVAVLGLSLAGTASAKSKRPGSSGHTPGIQVGYSDGN
jgi:hypothetical protein